jgi:hypothetical protein
VHAYYLADTISYGAESLAIFTVLGDAALPERDDSVTASALGCSIRVHAFADGLQEPVVLRQPEVSRRGVWPLALCTVFMLKSLER